MLGPVALGVLVIMLLVGIPQLFAKGDLKYVIKWLLIGLGLNILLISLDVYLFIPALTGPLGGMEFLWLPIIINGIFAMIMGGAVKSDSYDEEKNPHWAALIGLCAGLVLMGLIWLGVLGFNWVGKDKAKLEFANVQSAPMVNVVDANGNVTGQQPSTIPGSSDKHMIIVSPNNALNKGAGSLPSQYASVYQFGQYVPQKINGHQYYLSLLNFKDWFTTWSYSTTPGYILIDAENPLLKDYKITPYTIRYFDGGYFNYDVNRHLYLSGLTDYVFVDPTAELSDDGKLYETVGLAKYAFGWEGLSVEKVAVVDVTTGDYVVYAINDLPKWIDRALPVEATDPNIKWVGLYKNAGWFNFNNINTQKADDKPVIVYNEDSEQNSFQYLMTSTNGADNSGLSVILYSSVERKGLEYDFPTPITIGDDVVKLFENNPTIHQQEAKVDQIRLVYMYGTYTWVATMSTPTDRGSQYQYMAILAVSKSATSKDVVFEKDPELALRDYRNWLATNTNTSEAEANRQNSTKTFEGIITSIGTSDINGNTNHVFTMSDMNGKKVTYSDASGKPVDRIFVGFFTPDTQKLPLAKVGDHVLLTYQDTADNTLSVVTFEDYDVPPVK